MLTVQEYRENRTDYWDGTLPAGRAYMYFIQDCFIYPDVSIVPET